MNGEYDGNMNKNHLIAIGFGMLGMAFFTPISFAQTAYNATTTGNAGVSNTPQIQSTLNEIQLEQEAILLKISLQLESLSLEVQNIPTMPRETPDDRAALATEFGAIGEKLQELDGIAGTLAQVQNQESSLALAI
jgi:hypothetical protein